MSDRYQRLDETGLAKALIVAKHCDERPIDVIGRTIRKQRGGE